MGKIVTQTSFTTHSKDVQLKPRTPLWVIVNTGFTYLYVNNLLLQPGGRFGVDVSNLYRLGRNAKIINDTLFNIRFTQLVPSIISLFGTGVLNPAISPISGLFNPPVGGWRQSISLIETEFKPDNTRHDMTIHYSTSMTQIGSDERVKPKGALWQIINDGNNTVMLNNNLRVTSTQTFGLDVTNLFTTDVHNIVCDTEIDVRFLNDVLAPVVSRKSCQLVETSFKIVR